MCRGCTSSAITPQAGCMTPKKFMENRISFMVAISVPPSNRPIVRVWVSSRSSVRCLLR